MTAFKVIDARKGEMTITTNDIAEALLNNEFCFYYQPQIDLQTHRVCGAEALIRWIKPSGEIVQPCDFIPFCEETGFISIISYHMIDVFIDDVSNLVKLNDKLQYAMNLSVLDLKNKDILKKINEKQDEEYRSNINYEVTESSLNNLTEELLMLDSVSLIMDDYGTGYSNLFSLINTPFKKIKLDHTIIGNIFDKKKNQIIVTETIALARRLGMGVVAEGVENFKQYEFLLENRCTEIQGYHISKPLPYNDFIAFITDSETFFSYENAIPVKLTLINHMLWIDNITDIVHKIIQKESVDEKDLFLYIKNENECDFGLWYYGHHHDFFQVNENFIALKNIHHQVHVIALDMLEYYHSNDIHKLLADLKLLHIKSIELTKRLYNFNSDILKYNITVTKNESNVNVRGTTPNKHK